MKFLCLDCDRAMDFAERQLPGDGTLAAVYTCGGCRREMALLTNPMETRLVSSMGVKIGGREVPEQPMELLRSNLEGGDPDAFGPLDADGPAVPAEPSDGPPAAATETGGPATSSVPGGAGASGGGGDLDGPAGAGGRPAWSPEAVQRLGRVPRFVRGMVKRIYTDYARERSIPEITPEVMDRARSDLGLEGM